MVRGHWCPFLVCAALSVGNSMVVSAQLPIREPTPESAIPAILALFDRYSIVGMHSAHRIKDLDDLILTLLRTPAFADAVNDIVVECGNVRHQSILDRYIAGEAVAMLEVQRVWRETTVPQMCSVSPFYAELFPLVRRINQALPPAKRLRVLAADSPIDWTTVGSRADFNRFYSARDSNIAAVVEREVLNKHRKALMLFGSAHLAHGLTNEAAAAVRQLPGGFAVASAVGRYEERHPGVTFTIDLFGCGSESTLGAAARSWPVPSLLKTRDTRLASQPNSVLPGPDGMLYLGHPGLLLYEMRPAFAFLDDSLVAELRRMSAFMPQMPPISEYIEPQSVRERDTNPFLCNSTR
jgi:hypothetical protein